MHNLRPSGPKLNLWFATGFLTLIAMGLLGHSLRARTEQANSPLAPVLVSTAQVKALDLQRTIVADGALEYEREAPLAFRVPGVVTQILVDESDRIEVGQLLAEIDPSAIDSQATATALEVETARRDLERTERLFQRGFVSPARVEEQRSMLAAAEARADASGYDRRSARLASPAAGIVLSRDAEPGQAVAAGQTILSIADSTSRLMLRVSLADKDAAALAPGAEASVMAAALPSPIKGSIVRIAERAHLASGTLDVSVEVPAIPGLRSGMLASAAFKVDVGATLASVSVPSDAIVSIDGENATVFISDGNGLAHLQEVEFFGFREGHALIRGPSAGAEVVTRGAGFLRDGQRIATEGD